jgi:hypothetical protein
MNNATQPEYITGHDVFEVTPQQRRLITALRSSDLFARVVDSLPPSRARATLRLWGMLHQVYPDTEEAIAQSLDELARAIRLHRGLAHSSY